MKYGRHWFNTTILVVLLAFNSSSKADDAGVVLTFDDSSITQWFDYFSSQTSDVRATFFTSNWHTYSAEEIAMLRNLEASGYEIGAHTYDHSGAQGVYGLDPNRISEYVNEQIIPSLNNMRADGFSPVSFAFPYGEHNAEYDSAVRAYFPYIRGVSGDANTPLNQIDHIYHNAPKNYKFLDAEGLDTLNNRTINDVRNAFIRAKNNNEIVNLFAHRILEPAEVGTTLGMSRVLLDNIIQEAKNQGLKFYTYAEAYQIGNKGSISTQILGNDVRITWSNIDSDFIGIVPIEIDEWQQGMPKVDFSSQQSGDVTISVTNPLNQQKYRAIFYKNSIRRFISEPFYIGGTTPPLSPTILNPRGNATLGSNGQLTLSWNAIPGVSLYEYEGYSTNTNGVINYNNVIFSKEITAANANCSSGSGVCSTVETVPQSLSSGVWKIRSRYVVTKGDYSDKVYFTLGGQGGSDTIPPVITLLGSNPITVAINTNYSDAGATATDNFDPTVSVSINTSAVNTSQVGSYNVTFTASDVAGNLTTVTRTVIVSDGTSVPLVPPIIVSPLGPSTTTSGEVVLSWNSVPGATSYDFSGYEVIAGNINYSSVLFDRQVSAINAGCATGGMCTVSENISASSGAWKIRSNSATQSTDYSDKSFFTLTDSGASDTTPPIIALHGSNPVNIVVNTNYIDAGATASDYVDGAVNVNIDTANVNTSQAGSYIVTFTASDLSGNVATLTRTVVVSNVNTGVLVPPSIISPIGVVSSTGGILTLSWNSVSAATSYDFSGYEVTASGSINYSNVLFDRQVSAVEAGCASGGVCTISVNISSVSGGTWKIRSNSSSNKSDYSDRAYFTL